MIFIAFGPLLGVAQSIQNNYLPDYYSSVVVNHLALVNPAWISSNETRASLNCLYKSRMGLLNEVSTQTAYADITFKPERQLRQVVRVVFQNEKEGPYISSPKIYGNYSIRVPITADISISAGLALGVSAHNFSAPSGTGSGSAPDGSGGLIFRFKKTEIGAASYQFLNNKLYVLNSYLILERYFQYYIQSEKALNGLFVLKGNVLWRQQSMKDIVNTTAMVTYREFLTMGVMYQYLRGMSFLTSVQINAIKNPIILNLSYNSTFMNSVLVKSPSFEIGLQYKINR